MSWLREQWRGRTSVETALFTVFTILGLPFAASAAFLAYASIFDAALWPAAEFSHRNLVLTFHDLPDLLAVTMAMASATLIAVPFAIPFIAAITGVHQLIALTRSGGGSGPTNRLRRLGTALRHTIVRISSPRSSQRAIAAHA